MVNRNLDIDASVKVDPAACIFAKHLYQAAADPDSTKNLPKVPTHEEFMKGMKEPQMNTDQHR